MIIRIDDLNAASFTNYLITTRNDEVTGAMKVDIRGNSTLKNLVLKYKYNYHQKPHPVLQRIRRL